MNSIKLIDYKKKQNRMEALNNTLIEEYGEISNQIENLHKEKQIIYDAIIEDYAIKSDIPIDFMAGSLLAKNINSHGLEFSPVLEKSYFIPFKGKYFIPLFDGNETILVEEKYVSVYGVVDLSKPHYVANNTTKIEYDTKFSLRIKL